MLSIKGSLTEYSGILRLLTMFEKKVFKTSATSLSLLIISSFSTIIIFSFKGHFSERNGLTVFQNFCCLIRFSRLNPHSIAF